MFVYISWHAFHHIHRPPNALLAALEVSLHVSLTYALIKLELGVVFLFLIFFFEFFCFNFIFDPLISFYLISF